MNIIFAAATALVIAIIIPPAHAQNAPPGTEPTAIPDKIHSVAVFAGGCFWCVEAEYEGLKGVSGVTSGYVGKQTDTPPTYEQVSTGESGYVEAVAVTYDPNIVSYERLLDVFWGNIDPFDEEGQFCDKGSQYVAGIYYKDDEEAAAARKSLIAIEQKHGRKVATNIEKFEAFYPAEDYHQDFHRKNEARYKRYKAGCGRTERLEEIRRETE